MPDSGEELIARMGPFSSLEVSGEEERNQIIHQAPLALGAIVRGVMEPLVEELRERFDRNNLMPEEPPVASPPTRLQIFQHNVQQAAIQIVLNPCEAIADFGARVQGRINNLSREVTATLEQYGFFATTQRPGSDEPEVVPLLDNQQRNSNN